MLSFSVASVVEDVLQQQHENRSCDLDFDARRAQEAALRRYEAVDWLRKLVGIVGAKDLPGEPSEEEFRFGLRSGIILCNALNKIHPGLVQKVVQGPSDSALIPDGAALSVYQYFENVRNFLVAVQELGIPTFETSDLEQGGKSSRVVNCILALKSYNERKQAGGNGVCKFGGNVKTSTSGKQFGRKNSEPFTSSLSRSMSTNERCLNGVSNDTNFNRTPSSSLSMLVRSILLDKKPEDVPNLVESILSKVVEEFEHHIPRNNSPGDSNRLTHKPSLYNMKIEQEDVPITKRGDILQKHNIYDKDSETRSIKQQTIVDQQHKDIKVLKENLSTTKAGIQFMQMKFYEEFQNLGFALVFFVKETNWGSRRWAGLGEK